MDTSQLRREEFWRSFAAGLRTDGSMLQKASPLALPPEAVPEFMRQLKEDGYFQQSADWGVDLKLMANTARAISQADLPPVFAFLYDEFWYPFFRLRSVYEGLLGGRYYILPGCWVWNVDPKKGDSGGRRTVTRVVPLFLTTDRRNRSRPGFRFRQRRR